MYYVGNELRVNLEDINNFCKNCGTCCQNLTLQDKIELVRHFKHPERFLTGICPYSSKYGCIKYKDRPQVCREWKCGVVEMLKDRFKETGKG